MSRKNKVQLTGWAILSSALVIATVLTIIAATMSLTDRTPAQSRMPGSSLSAIASR